MQGQGSDKLYFEAVLPGDSPLVNGQIWEQYAVARNQAGSKRSHHFSGRYENIYIDREYVPALESVLEAARDRAGRFLVRPADDLSIGFWFNEMQPGHVTQAHRHDEDDELLSAVYYVRVPPDAGKLILTNSDVKNVITPREGVFIYFQPDVLHEVTENKSTATRLSIGMNFGMHV